MNLGAESEQVEFKRSTGEHREAMESIASILNKHGSGVLYFGVRNDGEVMGQDVSDKTLRSISQEIGSKIEPRITPQIRTECEDSGKTYIRIDFEGDETPYACEGRYRIRRADEDVLMTPAQVKRMFAAAIDREVPWDTRLSGCPVSDVRAALLHAYIDAGIKKNRIPTTYARSSDAANVLERLGLARDGRLTNAATVLFCRSPSHKRLTMGVLAGNDRVNILDLQQEDAPVLELIDKAEYYVSSNIRRRIVIDGSPTREEIPEIPREAIREAVINAFCHKEHQGDSRVMIDIFTDTVQITNPGLFPAGTTPDDYLKGVARAPQNRNPRIADALFRGGYIEAFGSGLRRIKQACDEAGVRFEYFQEGNATRVAFHRPGSHVELVSSGNSNEADAKIGRENRTRKSDAKIGRENRTKATDRTKRHIVQHIASAAEPLGRAAIMEATGLGASRTSELLGDLVSDGILAAQGSNRWRTYMIANERAARRYLEEGD